MKSESSPTVLEGDAEVAARLRLAVTRLSRRLRHQAETGIGASQLSALSTVERRGPMTLGDLASVERVQPPSMTRLVARLEEAGLVERQACEQDRRVARVRVTAAGRHLLQRSRTRKDAYLARRLQALDDAGRTRARDVVGVLEQMLDDVE